MFTGREYVEKFGVYEYRNRAYHPGLGRFMSEDPKGFDGGDYNLFRYVHNDPLDLVDPMGLLEGSMGQQEQKALLVEKQEVTGSHIKEWVAVGTITFKLEKISGNQNIHVDRLRDRNGQLTPELARTEPHLETNVAPTGDKSATVFAATKIDVKYVDKAKPEARAFARDTEPDHYNDIKKNFYDVAVKRVKGLNNNSRAFKSVGEALRAMEGQLRQLFDDARDFTRRAHDNYDGVHNHCEHCYQDPDPFSK